MSEALPRSRRGHQTNRSTALSTVSHGPSRYPIVRTSWYRLRSSYASLPANLERVYASNNLFSAFPQPSLRKPYREKNLKDGGRSYNAIEMRWSNLLKVRKKNTVPGMLLVKVLFGGCTWLWHSNCSLRRRLCSKGRFMMLSSTTYDRQLVRYSGNHARENTYYH